MINALEEFFTTPGCSTKVKSLDPLKMWLDSEYGNFCKYQIYLNGLNDKVKGLKDEADVEHNETLLALKAGDEGKALTHVENVSRIAREAWFLQKEAK